MAYNIHLAHKKPLGLSCGQVLQEKRVHKRAAGVVGQLRGSTFASDSNCAIE